MLTELMISNGKLNSVIIGNRNRTNPKDKNNMIKLLELSMQYVLITMNI